MIYIFIICVIAIMVFLALVASRSQALQRFAVLGLALILMVTVCTYVGCERYDADIKAEYMHMYALCAGEIGSYMTELEAGEEPDWETLDGYLDALPYQCLGALLAERKGNDGTYLTRISVGEDIRILTSDWDAAYSAVTEAMDSKQASCIATGYDTGLIVVMDSEQAVPDYTLFIEVSFEPVADDIDAMKSEMIRAAIILGAIGIVLLAIIIYLQGRQMRSMVRLITRVAAGKEHWDSDKIKKGVLGESNEMRALKNSLMQLINDNDKTNYSKFRMLQAYYRFAPKEIEHILNKPSILDVEVPDDVSSDATIAIVSSAISGRLERKETIKCLNENYRMISKARDAAGGVLLCGNADLSEICSLFLGDTKAAIQFGIDVVTGSENIRTREQTFVLLHHTGLVYGVAGDTAQASTYVLSADMRILNAYTEQMRALGIRMAVTDAVHELIDENTASRYIGFVEKGIHTFKLYEILDAYPANERQSRLSTRAKFKDALNLFYGDDFYLARSMFTEVLKENPTDEVARRYVFICERCLEEKAGQIDSYGLFYDTSDQ